jgi:hypothetical protein
MSTPSDQVRHELAQAVTLVRAYSVSTGVFHNWEGVRTAILLAMDALERAKNLVSTQIGRRPSKPR